VFLGFIVFVEFVALNPLEELSKLYELNKLNKHNKHLALSLFVSRIITDYSKHTFPFNYPALIASLLYG
jgi:hypothetical protein